jgi:dolichol kinase
MGHRPDDERWDILIMTKLLLFASPLMPLSFGAVAQTTFYSINTMRSSSTIISYGIPCISAYLFSTAGQMRESDVSNVCLISAIVFENSLVSEAFFSAMVLVISCIATFVGIIFQESFVAPRIGQTFQLIIFSAVYQLALKLTLISSNVLGPFTFLVTIYAWHRANRDFKLQFTFLEHSTLILWTGIVLLSATRIKSDRTHTEDYHQQQILYVVHAGLAAVLCVLFCMAIIFGINLQISSRATEYRLSSQLTGTKTQKCLIYLLLFLGGVLLLVVPCLSYVLNGSNPAVWIINFLVMDEYCRLYLAIYWVCLVIVFVFAANALVTYSSLPKFCNRKLFHLLMIFIVAPGLLTTDMYSFTILALGVAFCAFLVLETFRVLVLVPYGSDPISSYYELFLDSRDSKRSWTSSNMSLLVGCAFPAFICAHWLDPPQCFSAATSQQGGDYMSSPCGLRGSEHSRLLLALRPLLPHLGWITVGVGDSAAAIIGSQFGKHKWKGTSRTVEGSVAMFLSMFFVSLCVVYSSGGDDWPRLPSSRVERLFSFRIILPIFVTLALSSLCEAFTFENDNLVLPLFSVAFYVAIVSNIM